MKKLLFFFFSFVWAQQAITLEAIYQYYRFFPRYSTGKAFWRPMHIHWWKEDNRYYTFLSDNHLIKSHLWKANENDTLIYAKEWSPCFDTPIETYFISEDLQYVLVKTKSKSIYRYSDSAQYYFMHLQQKQCQSIMNGAFVQEATFSPNGKWVAFVYRRNLYVQNIENNRIYPITDDGAMNQIINGHTDWVYEEEFGFTRAYEWAQNSRYIAFLRFDESQVPSYTLVHYGDSTYPTYYTFKYPKAGYNNAIVTLWIYDLTTQQKWQIPLQADANAYIPRIRWYNNQLFIFYLNRQQNHLQLYRYNPKTKQLKKFLEEKSNTYLEISNDMFTPLPSSLGFLWKSERDGYYHIYHYDTAGKLIRQITKGKWEVAKILGFDAKKKWIYYLSTEPTPLERHLYRISLDGKKKERLTFRQGTYKIQFAPNMRYYLSTFSSDLTPPYITLEDAYKKKTLKVLVSNDDLKKRLSSYALSPKRYFKIPINDSLYLNAWMITPVDFDSSKRYPVLFSVYGGPGSQTVKREYSPFEFFWYQYLAQQGIIVVSVDNRGTGARGRTFRTCTYRRLGIIESDDMAAAAQYLKKLSFVAPDKIGIWGWSFGGYLSAMCLLRYPKVFRLAVSVAPVSDWRLYDTIYTERYMDTPQNNPEGYQQTSLLTYAANLEGDFLLIHGTADDNVHWQHSTLLAKALIKADKHFQMFVYPDKRHGIAARYHVFSTITNFLIQHLK